MVSTESLYKSDNIPFLKNSLQRGDRTYQVRLYGDRSPFVSAQSASLRMRMLLGFIEARAVVIDAFARTDGSLQYLSVICSSPACPDLFSRILAKTVPRALIEELSEAEVRDRIASGGRLPAPGTPIPFESRIRHIHESRKFLLALLLEYRALLAEYSGVVAEKSPSGPFTANAETSASFLVFDREGGVCAIPDFQVEQLSLGANGGHFVHVKSACGPRLLACRDILCVKEMDIASFRFAGRIDRGYYAVRAGPPEKAFEFCLIVPSFL